MMGRAVNGAGSIYKTEQGWRGSILLNGRRRYASGKNKTEVSEKLRALKRQADDGFVQKGRSPKLSAWIQHWLDATAPLNGKAPEGLTKRHSIKTDSDYRKIVRLYLPTWLGDITLAKLEPERLEECYADLAKKPLSQSTIYQLHSIIRASLSLAEKRGSIPKNPAKGVIAPPQPKATEKRKPFTRAEQNAIRTVLFDSRSHARWELGMSLGPRPGEVLGLERKHLDFDARTIRIEQQIQMIDKKLTLIPHTKVRLKPRVLPMPEFLATLLSEHLQEQEYERAAAGEKWADWRPDGKKHDFVFTSRKRPGMPITPGGDDTQWRQILDRAGLPASEPYRARHTAASEMIAAGLDLTVIAEIMGHSVKVLQDTYAHAIEERKLAAATVLDLAYESIHKPLIIPIDAEIDAVTKKEPHAG